MRAEKLGFVERLVFCRDAWEFEMISGDVGVTFHTKGYELPSTLSLSPRPRRLEELD